MLFYVCWMLKKAICLLTHINLVRWYSNISRWCHLSQLEVWKWKTSEGGVRKKWAALSTTSITHPNLQTNHQWLSCVVGDVGGRFWQRRRMYGINKTLSRVLLHHESGHVKGVQCGVEYSFNKTHEGKCFGLIHVGRGNDQSVGSLKFGSAALLANILLIWICCTGHQLTAPLKISYS